jgi:hypothetical protein
MLKAKGLELDDVITRGDYRAVREAADIDAVVNVRQFYGTEITFVETRTGNVLASGCWRTGPVEIVNHVIRQLEKREPTTRVCPVRMK